MKNILMILFTLIGLNSYAQVGINTSTPQATLEIATDSNIGVPSYMNGGLNIGYPGVQNKAIDGRYMAGIESLAHQQILMRDSLSGRVDYMYRYALDYHALRPSHIGSTGSPETLITELDHTILVRGDVHLPLGPKYNGKIITLIYDSQEEKPFKIIGPLKYNSYLSGNLVEEIYISRVNSSYILQCDGVKWYVVGGFEQEDNNRVEIVTLYDNDIVRENDHRIFVKGNITLPTVLDPGYELTLTYNGNGTQTFTISGDMDDNSTILNTYTLSATNGSKAIKLQSDGTYWRILAKR